MPTIVVLSRYFEIFRGFRESVDKLAPDHFRILVRDPGADDGWPELWRCNCGGEFLAEAAAKAHADPKYPHYVCHADAIAGKMTPARLSGGLGRGWRVIMGPEKFAMAANANLGAKAAPADSDILYCGDDIRFLEKLTVERLQQIAYDHPDVGILSPRLRGRASPSLGNPLSACDTVLPAEMWFPCVYIKRELISKIGYWDERFDSFGDDFDFSVRAAMAGYRSAVTNVVTVQHDGDAGGGPSTFIKRGGAAGWQKQSASTYEKLIEKYGVPREVLVRYMQTGDLTLLGQHELKS